MAAEILQKFDPSRTMHLRGFDRRGAAAALHSASANACRLSGVFRSADDFAVLVLHDVDNRFEHNSIRYLPDGDLSGMTLSFDLLYQGLQPIDSPKFQSVPWGRLSYLTMSGTAGEIDLFEGPAGVSAVQVGGDYAAASAVVTFEDNGIQGYDRVTLWYQNIAFDYIMPYPLPADPLGSAIDALESQINGFNWPAAQPTLALRAARSGNTLGLTAARYGTANATGQTVDWVSGNKFAGLAAGDSIRLGGAEYVIASVASKEQLTLTAPAASDGTYNYLADRGGVDGDTIRIYRLAKNSNFTTTEETVQLTGGSSAATWRVGLDFSALGLDDLRQCWLTLAPRLTDSTEYSDTEWDVTFSNIAVTDPNGKRPLKIAGPGSVRIGNRSAAVEYPGSAWTDRYGFYDQGRARVSSSSHGDAIIARYRCQHTHDLYLGAELGPAGTSIAASLDGDTATGHTTQLGVSPPVVSLIKLRENLPPGEHELLVSSDGLGDFVFDHVLAAVPGDVNDPPEPYADSSAATDYDTDAAYKLSPQRLVWQLRKLGFEGDINHFQGNFFHYQRRKRAGTGTRNTYQVTFSGAWAVNDTIFIDIDKFLSGGGTSIGKTVFPADTNESIARHFAYFINGSFVALYAEAAGDTLTIRPRANLQGFTIATRIETGNGSGAIAESGNVRKGGEGVWELDATQPNKLNYAARKWLADFSAEIAANGMTATVAYNLEGYNPPDATAEPWTARYWSGEKVRTSVGFGSEAEARIVSASETAGVVLEIPAHGLETGDALLVEGFVPAGQPNGDGSWTAAVVDADHLQLTQATGLGDFDPAPADEDADKQLIRRQLKTEHLAPNAAVTDFLEQVFLETADIQAASGLTPRLQLGEQLWWFFSDWAGDISSATATAPIDLYVPNHGRTTGETAIVAGVSGVEQANGTWTLTVVDDNVVSLDGSDGTAAGSDAQRGAEEVWRIVGGSMAFYDEETKAEADLALGRPLAKFSSQDSDPALNGSADADFLRDRLQNHLEAIVSHVRAEHPTAVFELLYPYDVLHPDAYHTLERPYPQGGRLNHHVSTPPVWKTQADAARRLKIEALSWGADFRNLNRAKQAITLWNGGSGFDWPRSSTTYLLPWFNGGTPWQREYLLALKHGPATITFWALDHKKLLEWPDLPKPGRRSGYWGR